MGVVVSGVGLNLTLPVIGKKELSLTVPTYKNF